MPRPGETGRPAAHSHEEETHNLPPSPRPRFCSLTLRSNPSRSLTPLLPPGWAADSQHTKLFLECSTPHRSPRTHSSRDQLDSHLSFWSQFKGHFLQEPFGDPTGLETLILSLTTRQTFPSRACSWRGRGEGAAPLLLLCGASLRSHGPGLGGSSSGALSDLWVRCTGNSDRRSDFGGRMRSRPDPRPHSKAVGDECPRSERLGSGKEKTSGTPVTFQPSRGSGARCLGRPLCWVGWASR